ncbi:hypothetical protein EDC01DRAFT_761491 [Geopyxis carbonaria]|nr:hypothetical protein EDC01DRAFT_761491 [Geopyxis carbonaria]
MFGGHENCETTIAHEKPNSTMDEELREDSRTHDSQSDPTTLQKPPSIIQKSESETSLESLLETPQRKNSIMLHTLKDSCKRPHINESCNVQTEKLQLGIMSSDTRMEDSTCINEGSRTQVVLGADILQAGKDTTSKIAQDFQDSEQSMPRIAENEEVSNSVQLDANIFPSTTLTPLPKLSSIDFSVVDTQVPAASVTEEIPIEPVLRSQKIEVKSTDNFEKTQVPVGSKDDLTKQKTKLKTDEATPIPSVRAKHREQKLLNFEDAPVSEERGRNYRRISQLITEDSESRVARRKPARRSASVSVRQHRQTPSSSTSTDHPLVRRGHRPSASLDIPRSSSIISSRSSILSRTSSWSSCTSSRVQFPTMADFEVLPRDEHEYTTFPKFESNARRKRRNAIQEGLARAARVFGVGPSRHANEENQEESSGAAPKKKGWFWWTSKESATVQPTSGSSLMRKNDDGTDGISANQ